MVQVVTTQPRRGSTHIAGAPHVGLVLPGAHADDSNMPADQDAGHDHNMSAGQEPGSEHMDVDERHPGERSNEGWSLSQFMLDAAGLKTPHTALHSDAQLGGAVYVSAGDHEGAQKQPEQTDLSRSEAALLRWIRSSGVSKAAANDLLRLLRQNFEARHIRFATLQSYNFHAERTAPPIFTRFVGRTAVDGQNEASVVYRDAWDVMVSMLQNPVVFRDLKLQFVKPSLSPTGARQLGSFNSSFFLEAAYKQYAHIPNISIVGLVLGSDETKVSNWSMISGSHPVLMHIPNVDGVNGFSPAYWRCIGFVPTLLKSKMTRPQDSTEFRSRSIEVLHDTYLLVLDSIFAVIDKGGERVQCADGQVYLIMPLPVMFVGDRQLHNELMHVHAHNCFHCKVPKDCLHDAHSSYDSIDMRQIEKDAQCGCDTGVFVDRRGGTHVPPVNARQKAIIAYSPDGTEKTVIQSRFEEYQQGTGFAPMPNMLGMRLLKYNLQLPHMCTDDRLHHIQLGMFVHLLQASVSRLFRALCPTPMDEETQEGAQKFDRSMAAQIMQRLTERMQTCQTPGGLTSRAAIAIQAAVMDMVDKKAYKFKLGLTGKEVEDCFVAFVKCLPLLIRPELDKIHGRAGSSPSQPGSRLNDPTSEVIRVLCAFLRWDGALSAPALDVDQVASVGCESSSLRLRCLVA